MANQDRLSLALRPAGDAISDVLDAFQEDKPGLSAANCYLLIQDLKVLVKLIQVLESEHAARAFRTTPSYTKGEIGEVLHDCGVLAADLKERIQDQILQDDVDLCEQTARLKAKLGLFLRTHGKNKEVLHPGPTQAERLEMDDLRLRNNRLLEALEEDQLEIARLNSILEARGHQFHNADPVGKAAETNDELKVQHIKVLHQSIIRLGYRFPRDHGLNTWEELRGELPTMLDHIKGIDKQLRELEDRSTPVSATFTDADSAPRQMKTDRQGPNTPFSNSESIPRIPSPTESNVSVQRDPPSKYTSASKTTKSRSTDSKSSGVYSARRYRS